MAAPALNQGSVRYLHSWLEEQRRGIFIDACILEERRVTDTLRKFDDGTFGDCVMCGEPIDRELLGNRPWAKRCATCNEPAQILQFTPREREELDPPAA